MLDSLKSNEPYFNFIYMLLSVVILLPHFFIIPYFEINKLSLFSKLDGFAELTSFPLLNIFTAVLLVAIGGILCNRLFNNNQFHASSTQLPGLFYIFFTGGATYYHFDNTLLLANIPLLFGIQSQIRIFRQPRVSKQCFDAGLWYGLASVIYFPLMLTIAAIYSGLAIARTFQWREYTLTTMGFLFSWIWLCSIVYLGNLQHLFLPVAFEKLGIESLQNGMYPQLAFFILIAVGGLLLFNKTIAQSLNVSRNNKYVTLAFSLILTLSFLMGSLGSENIPAMLLGIPLALIMPFLFLELPRKKLADGILILTLLSPFLALLSYFS